MGVNEILLDKKATTQKKIGIDLYNEKPLFFSSLFDWDGSHPGMVSS